MAEARADLGEMLQQWCRLVNGCGTIDISALGEANDLRVDSRVKFPAKRKIKHEKENEKRGRQGGAWSGARDVGRSDHVPAAVANGRQRAAASRGNSFFLSRGLRCSKDGRLCSLRGCGRQRRRSFSCKCGEVGGGWVEVVVWVSSQRVSRWVSKVNERVK
jgi:hypothetical protein